MGVSFNLSSSYQVGTEQVHDEGDVLPAGAEVMDLGEAFLDAQGLVEPVLEEQHRDLGVGRLQLDGELGIGVDVSGQPQLPESPVGDLLAHQVLLADEEVGRRLLRLELGQGQELSDGEDLSPVLPGGSGPSLFLHFNFFNINKI